MVWRGEAGHGARLLTVAEHKHGCEGQLTRWWRRREKKKVDSAWERKKGKRSTRRKEKKVQEYDPLEKTVASWGKKGQRKERKERKKERN